jgi:hypothetical protein
MHFLLFLPKHSYKVNPVTNIFFSSVVFQTLNKNVIDTPTLGKFLKSVKTGEHHCNS